MRRNLYGKKMFIADLILTSIWAFFFSCNCGPGLLLMIPIRIALCFEMERKSPWTLVSAAGFLTAYICADCFSRPFERMFYIFFCAIGESELMTDIFSEPFEWEMEAWIGSISVLWFLWLTILPVIIGSRLHNLRKINWKRKWIWLYLLPFTGFLVWVMFNEGPVGGVLGGLVIACLPVVYWSVYERKGRSAIEIILSNRTIRWYLTYSVFMLIVITIGVMNISFMKFVGVLVLPPVFYIVFIKSMRLGTVITRCFIALSLSGWLYWHSLDSEQWVTCAFLGIALLLIGYVGITTIAKTRKWFASFVMIILLSIVIIPGTLGMNPYLVTDADCTRIYGSNLSAMNGVYVVEKYYDGQQGLLGRKYGLRDRYGLILPIEYKSLTPLDLRKRYIILESGNSSSDKRIGVYDLWKRKFVLWPGEVTAIEKIDYKSFKLIKPDARYFATLYLPGEYRDVYYSDAHIEPHFAEGEITVNEFIGRYNNPDELYEGAYSHDVTAKDLSALRLLVLIAEFGGDSPSPVNELNFGRAVKKIFADDTCYKGNIEKAFEDVARLRESMETDPEGIIEQYSAILLRMAKVKTALAYDEAITDMSDNESIINEYTAWHHLMEAMENYLDYLYTFEAERPEPANKESVIIGWYDQRGESLQKDREIISGKLIYALDTFKAVSLRSDSDYMEFFSNFHSYSRPYYYHPMWNEVKTAFDEWRNTRETIAGQLDPHASLSYREYSKEVINSVFSCIEGLDWPGFRPVFY